MAIRELGTTKYSSEKHAGANMLMNFGLQDANILNPRLTKMWGSSSDGERFPLLSATEGQGAIKKVVLTNTGDTQYYYNVEGRRRHTVTLLNTSATSLGRSGVVFELDFSDNWLIYQHTAISPSGVQCRVQNDGVRVGNGYRYRLVVMGSDPNRVVPVSDLRAGATWAMGAASIPATKSDGNRSNSQAPFKATNQYGYYRYSYGIEGNMGDRVVNIQFDMEGGGTTDKWMPYEMKNWELDRRQMIEEDLWFSEYNRNSVGAIELIDEFTGEFVPKGAGVREQIKAVGNLETYSDLTLRVIDNLIDRIYSAQQGTTDAEEIICYCGYGFNRMFQDAINRDLQTSKYFQAMGDATIGSDTTLMSYGRYYNRYKMLNNKVLSLRPVTVFDKGIRAEQQRLGSGVNPELMYKGLPLMSYTAAFIDHGNTSNGEANVQYICEEGREYQTEVYKGMAKLPSSWQVAPNSALSTRKDVASYEVMGSYGINISNATTSFMLELAL